MLAAVGVAALSHGVTSLLSRHSPRAAGFGRSLAVFVALCSWRRLRGRRRAPGLAQPVDERPGAGYAAYFFPHDEFYDAGVREAVHFVSRCAPLQSTVAHETPGVVSYYLERFQRTDMKSRTISDPKFELEEGVGLTYVIVQRGR